MTVNAITGLSEIPGSPASRVRSRQDEVERKDTKDSVEISPDARQAAEASRVALKPAGSEIRLDQVEAAKQRIQSGSYKVTEVVLEVAARISNYM